MPERLSTGLAGLDAQLGGGYPPGTVHLLVSEPMNALELFCYHFAAGGTKPGQAKGEGSQYVTTAKLAGEVKAGITQVGGDASEVTIEPLTLKGPPNVTGSRYILDCFSEYVLDQGWDKAFKRLQVLAQQARAAKTLLLVTVVPDLHDAAQLARLKLLADGVLDLGFDRQGFGLYPYLKVTKMKGVPDSARFLLFKETERGLFMESTRRVF
ncbi:MAG: RAD55 family ATPase [Candidatus Thermoplasmatota archaeon]